MIKTKNSIDAWKQSLNYIQDQGQNFIDENKRICREVLNLQVEIEEPEKDITLPINTLNKLHKWEYPPLDRIAQIILSKKPLPEYSYSYGPRLFNHQNEHNQVDNFIIPLLQDNPTSRRAIMTLWDVSQDSNSLKRDTPGFILIDCKLRNEKLNMTGIIRSNDMFFGWPANIYQMHVLQKYIAEKLTCKTGSITTISTSAHTSSKTNSHT